MNRSNEINKTVETYYIVPAWSDQAGQCRIVKTEGKVDAYHLYKKHPEVFVEVGIMNSRGQVVCLDNKTLLQEMHDDAPLMAGAIYYF